MRRNAVLLFTAILFLVAGITATYFALSIPNDIRAEALLRTARNDLRAGKRDAARVSLEEIVRKYHRTDAAAAATTSLIAMVAADQRAQQKAVRLELESMRRRMDASLRKVETLATTAKNVPPPAPAVQPPAAIVPPPPAAAKPPAPAVKPPAKVTPRKKAPVRKKQTRRRRRAERLSPPGHLSKYSMAMIAARPHSLQTLSRSYVESLR
ncbi:MAG TPA: hypothetical protein VNM92_09250 [Thermoanaerobaculia bacterium]|nr:hypothetical protein [Thermoanaerobaculia bacterium]